MATLPAIGAAITGYEHTNGRVVEETARGQRFTGWVVIQRVRKYRTYGGEDAWAVVLEYHPTTRRKPYYGAGYSFGDGMLLRGEVVGYDRADAQREALGTAEYWGQRDAIDADKYEHENDEEEVDRAVEG